MDATQMVEAMLPPLGMVVFSVHIPEDGTVTSRKQIVREMKQAFFDDAGAAFITKYDLKQYATYEDAFDNAPLTHQILCLELT
jgi:hypothetical protein